MKKTFILLIALQLASCDLLMDCPEIIKGKPDGHLITDKELATVRYLFSANNLSLNNFIVYRLQLDDLGHHHVRCYQYINNLIVFTDEVIFHFDSQNRYYFLSGEIISEIDLGKSPSMNISEVRKTFIDCLQKDNMYSGSLNKIKNDCLRCEFGYYDLNAGISYTEPEFTLAWRIRPDRSDYPVAFINDITGALIYYDNGIRY